MASLSAPGSGGVRPFGKIEDQKKKKGNGGVLGAPNFKGPLIYGDPKTEKMLSGNGNGKKNGKKRRKTR